MVLLGSGLIFGLLVLGFMSMFIFNNPTDRIAAEKAADAATVIEGQAPADPESLDQALAAQEAAAAAERAAAERERRIAEIRAGAAELAADPTAGRSSRPDRPVEGMPELDAELLARLEEADRVAGQRPAITGGTGNNVGASGGQGVAGSMPGAAGSNSAAPGGIAVFESYDETPTAVPSLGEALGQEDRRQAAPPREPAAAEFFETTQPTLPPSSRLITQGSQIRAVLLSRIDTRNPGNVIAQVTADVYDSLRAELLLIPRGSRLIGTYATSITPGNERLALAFNRVMLPDGRAIDLGGMQATGNDGITGVEGDFHGNFLRAVGPAILTALVGSALDEATRPDAGESTVSSGLGGTNQAPTVAQQVVPQITQAVLERYRGAEPYVTAEPGQPIKVLVTADLEIPVLESTRR